MTSLTTSIIAKKPSKMLPQDDFRCNFSRKVIVMITKFCMVVGDISPHKSAGYDVTSYIQSAFIKVPKTAKNAASDGIGSNLSGAAFCLPHQLVGYLLLISRKLLELVTSKFTTT